MSESDTLASIEQKKIGDRPRLLGEIYTPAILKDFELRANDYLDEQGSTLVGKETKTVARGIMGQGFRDWYQGDRMALDALSLTEFMDEMRDAFLPTDWAQDLLTSIYQSTPGKRSAVEWAREAYINNTLLPAANRLTLDNLRALLQARLPPRLLAAIVRDPPELPKDDVVEGDTKESRSKRSLEQKRFTNWVAQLKLLEEQQQTQADEVQAAVREALRVERAKTRAAGQNSAPGRTSLRTSGPQKPSKASEGSPAGPGRKRLGPLTDRERSLLNEHQGCTKCRQLYAGHTFATCPNGWPSSDYQPLTEEIARAAKRKHDKHSAAAKASSSSSAKIEEPPTSESDSNSEQSDSYVLPDEPHMYPCLLATSDPLQEDRFHRVEPLIDSGCGTVMIKPEFADALGLSRFMLKQPEVYRGFKERHGTVVVKEFVKFRLVSPDRSWQSRKVYAKVTPSLFTELILGLPFLKRERILLDAKKHSAIAQRTGTDLLKQRFDDPKREPIVVEKPSPSKRRRTRTHRQQPRVNVPTPRSSVWKAIASRSQDMPELSNAEISSIASMVHHHLKQHGYARQDARPCTQTQPPVCEGVRPCAHAQPPDRQDVRPCTQRPPEELRSLSIIAAVKHRIEELQEEKILARLHEKFLARYKDRFPADIPQASQLPNTEYHRIRLKNADHKIRTRTYSCPQKYREAWKALIEQHLKAGRIRESSSPYAHPSFCVPKSDPNAPPRWVCDFRALNANTVRDRTPLPLISEILNDCAKGRYFAKIDMTNAFFQTPMHPKDIHLTAVTTPFGLFEWNVMPMGLSNSPATHQRRMYKALRHLIGKICHVYLDDIIIWSQSLDEHKRNIHSVMEALRNAHLVCSAKKTQLFMTEVSFLGHVISSKGIRADPKKVEAVKNWSRPTTTKQLRRFLGLVRYVSAFMPHLADHTSVLTPLTKKEYDKSFPEWTQRHQEAFEAIKAAATSDECLASIQEDSPGHIYVTTDASDVGTGAMLSIGENWESARPVAYDSMQLNSAQRNYPVHERELLAIVRALDKWRYHLLGTHFTVYTDHRTLEYFNSQPNLSRRQARWSEFLSQYDFDIKYIQGESNEVADALSRLPDTSSTRQDARPCEQTLADDASTATARQDVRPCEHCAPTTLRITLEDSLLRQIKDGYKNDEFCIKLRANLQSMRGNGASEENGLLYRDGRLVIPAVPAVRETLFQLAHDALGHFGAEKTYQALRGSYYWPGMKSQIENSYVPGCDACQRNKSSTTKPPGPLHPLPIPDSRFDSVAIDRVGPLPEEEGFNGVLTMTDRLGAADIRLIPCRMDMTAEECAKLFFEHWYLENGLPKDIVSDRDALFVSEFWTSLHQLIGVKLKMSTAFHPQTDGASERTNKTLNQLLRFMVDHQQHGWVAALPKVRFALMNTVNASTGYTPFYLRSGFNPRLIPPLIDAPNTADEQQALRQARQCITSMHQALSDAQDTLFEHKTRQAHFANAHRGPDDAFKVGDKVMLSTANRRREYKSTGEQRTAKLMPRSDGPFKVIRAFPDTSTYTLQLPGNSQTYPGFHASQLKRYVENDDTLYPQRTLERPGPVQGQAEEAEWELEAILSRRRRGSGWQYRVQFRGWGAEDAQWRSRSELRTLAPELLAEYEQRFPLP